MMFHRQGLGAVVGLAICMVPTISWGQGFYYDFSPDHGIRMGNPYFRLDIRLRSFPGAIVPWNSPPLEPWPEELRNRIPYGRQHHLRHEPSFQNSVAERLVAASELLADSLKRHSQGEPWLEFLDPIRIGKLARQSIREPLSEKMRTELRQLLTRYTGTENSTEFKWVVRIPGFKETKLLLDEWINSPAGSNSEPQRSQPSFVPIPLEPGTPQRHPDSRLELENQGSDPRQRKSESLEELPRPRN